MDWSQRSQAPLQAELQQKPSMQKPLTHSTARVHIEVIGFLNWQVFCCGWQ